MRILVLSDSHGDVCSLCAILRMHREADFVLFLGDGEDDFFGIQAQELLKNKRFEAFCGNCDFYSTLPKEKLMTIADKRILAMHGHTKSVKYGLESLIDAAKAQNADIAVYGHTHEPHTENSSGIQIMCPGAVKDGSYGIIDITDRGTICYTAEL